MSLVDYCRWCGREWPCEVELRDRYIEGLKDALEGMVTQFAYWSDSAGGYHTGGLSALEQAFDVLGWDDPHPAPEAQCDEPGCTKQIEAGWPSPDGYRRTCSEHYHAAQNASQGPVSPDQQAPSLQE